MALKHIVAIGVFLILVVGGGAYSYFSHANNGLRDKYPWESADNYTRSEILYCIHTDPVLWRGTCFSSLAKKLLAQFPLEKVLGSLAHIDTEDQIKQTCHSLVHYLGQDTYRTTKSLPETFQRCSAQIACGEGCFHGATEAYVAEHGANISESSISAACTPSPGESAMTIEACTHGLGHAFMLATNNDVPTSLQKCDALSGTDAQNNCYAGVFMENVFDYGNPDHPTNYVHPDDPTYPCSIVGSHFKNACYSAASDLIIQSSYADFEGGAAFCANVPVANQPNCYSTIGAESVLFFSDPSAIVQTCDLVPAGSIREDCLGQALKFRLYGSGGDGADAAKICAAASEADRAACNKSLSDLESEWQTPQAHS